MTVLLFYIRTPVGTVQTDSMLSVRCVTNALVNVGGLLLYPFLTGFLQPRSFVGFYDGKVIVVWFGNI